MAPRKLARTLAVYERWTNDEHILERSGKSLESSLYWLHLYRYSTSRIRRGDLGHGLWQFPHRIIILF